MYRPGMCLSPGQYVLYLLLGYVEGVSVRLALLPSSEGIFKVTLSTERTKAVPKLSAWHVKLRIRSKRIQQ